MSQQMLNRLGFYLINWQYVESIDHIPRILGKEDKKDTPCIIINYTSGKSVKITDKDKVYALLDVIGVFPDIVDDKTRKAMKQSVAEQNLNIKTDIPQPTQPLHTGITTDPRTFDFSGKVNDAQLRNFIKKTDIKE